VAKTDVDLEALKEYQKAKYTLLPLHKWDKTSTYKGKERQDGKRPIDRDWTNRPYNNATTIKHAQTGGNVGVRLTAEQLVIDVDPRNMPEGRDTFKELCEAIKLVPDDYPQVKTGSGGLHVYMRKSADVPVVDSIEGYDGVEFKTKGRQVVAAGSKHPNGNMYEWDFLGPNLEDADQAPDRLMALIRRPSRISSGPSGGGEHTQEEIATMLDELDPTDFRDQSAWLELMMACHHASGGDARSEFIDWSTRDPQYSADSWIVGRRWDSLHRDKGSGVTYRTLHKVMRDKGKQSAIPQVKAEDDFEDDLDLPGDENEFEIPEHERKGPMTRLNERLWAVMDGGKFRIMYEHFNPSTQRMEWVSATKNNALDMYANRKVEKINMKGEPVVVPVLEEWMQWGHRRTAQGVVFDPERDHKGFLNLWQGWAVDPAPGDWSLTEELIHEVLCNGDSVQSKFVMDWIAYMVQKPWDPPEVAICFRGDKGTGKSTLGEALVKLSGRHGIQVTSPRHVMGNFNIHLMDCIMLFADEAVRPTDKAGQAALKALITERQMAYEAKGIDLKTGINRIHVMMASNDDWFVDASAVDGERRYFVAEANNKRQRDTKFFGALKNQLYNKGGLAAMLHDMQLRDISGWAPRGNVPVTTALTEQKARNLEPVGQWWFNILDEGAMPCPLTNDDDDWDLGAIRVFNEDLKGSFEDFCRKNRLSPGSMNKSMDRYFWGELKKYCPSFTEKRDKIPEDRFDIAPVSSSDNRARCKAFPSMSECRMGFEAVLGGKFNWN
jgi:hypothetical protein